MFGAGAAIIGGVVVLAMTHLADWREPASEEEFEAIVQRAEELAARGYDVRLPTPSTPAGTTTTRRTSTRSPATRTSRRWCAPRSTSCRWSFTARSSTSPSSSPTAAARRRAYGLYQGDTVARDYFHDRIVIFRDTLMRDFGHDPELLKAQVTRTVRHELAHHLGWGEKGVRGLGL